MRLETDLAIIGGSLGGVAAALAALELGARVVMTEASDWLGGQLTSQGVTPLDEHAYIETFGATRRYAELRARVRAHYRRVYGAPERMPGGAPLNPGNGWVSRLCFEPRVGVAVLGEMLRPYLESGRLTVLYGSTPVRAELDGTRVTAVELSTPASATARLEAAYFLDATDLGDLLPLVGAPYVTGAEAGADTGEPAAPETANPREVQSFTFGFAVEYRPGEVHTISRPEGYARFRDAGLYRLTLNPGTQDEKRFKMFRRGPSGELPFWSYRRLLDADLLGLPGDVALINWESNDYFYETLLDVSPERRAHALAEARAQALGFLYWLQTEAPRDDGGYGYPELKLRRDVMATPDGLAKLPYIRESRRLVARTRVTERHLGAAAGEGVRAAAFTDSVGVGWYQLDVHRCVDSGATSRFEPTRPFQIPLGSLLPRHLTNLAAASKNIGTTHLANGAYRVHAVEWAVGEAAGTLMAWCLRTGYPPAEVCLNTPLLRRLQLELLTHGAPLAWTVDLPPGHPLFVTSQLLVLAGALVPGTNRYESLELQPGAPLTATELAAYLGAAASLLETSSGPGGVATLLERLRVPPPAPNSFYTLSELCTALKKRLEVHFGVAL